MAVIKNTIKAPMDSTVHSPASPGRTPNVSGWPPPPEKVGAIIAQDRVYVGRLSSLGDLTYLQRKPRQNRYCWRILLRLSCYVTLGRRAANRQMRVLTSGTL